MPTPSSSGKIQFKPRGSVLYRIRNTVPDDYYASDNDEKLASMPSWLETIGSKLGTGNVGIADYPDILNISQDTLFNLFDTLGSDKVYVDYGYPGIG